MRVRRTSPSHRRLGSRAVTGKFTAACFALSGLVSIAIGANPAGAASSHLAKSVIISSLKTSTFGTILISNTTVYTLKPSDVACGVACHKIWPEVILPKGVKKATAGKGVSAEKLGTIARPGGVLQVTYDGKALYWFAPDTARGEVRGNVTDTWGTWSDVVTVKPAGSGKTTTTTSPGGGGVGF